MEKIIIFGKRLLYNVAHLLRRAYWFVFHPHTRGVKCILEYEGKVLFVRLGYAHKGWTIPGGGVKCGELFDDAARRETLEETGVLITRVEKIGEYSGIKEYKHDTVEVFYAAVTKPDFLVDGFEVVEAKWASPDAPPTPFASRVPVLMKKFIEYKRRLF